MKQANELLIGGLKPDEIELVAKAARSLGEATGVSAAEGMNQLGDSLLRGNDRALKSLGIIIDTDKAFKDFAESIGTTTDKLNDQGKAAAIRQASFEALKKQTERLGEVTLDAGDKFDQLTTVLSNAKDEFFRAAANNKELNLALDNLVTVVKNINFKPLINGLATVLSLFSTGIKLASEFASAVQSFINKDSELDRSLAKTTTGFQLFDDGLKDVIDRLNLGTKESVQKAVLAYDKLGKIFVTMAKNGDLLDTQVNALNREFEITGKQVRAAAEDFGLVAKSQNLAAEAVTKLTKTTETSAESFINQASAAGKASESVKKAVIDAQKTAEDNPIEVPIIVGANRLGGSGGEGSGPSSIGSLFGDLGIGEELGNQLASDIASGLATGLDIALNGASGKETRAALSGFLTDIGATFADSALPGSGQFVQAFGGVFEAGIEHIFGGESAGLTARKAADKFFADAFDANRLGVIIDGQLQIIEDLVFKGDTLFGGDVDFTDNSFSQFFASLPDQARQAFQGVGAGFEELLGVGEDIGGQLAAVFANNVGGSLNNLQLLVQASGVSFEDLSKNVVNAFNNGKLSALEAQVALQGIAQVSQDGIPDGIGFTVQAFENLKAAGVKGGRALTDALKDIGFEAKEVGIRDFGALQANLVASGKFTQQEIEQLFKALADNGITSIEQLTSATDQQLIPILAQLEAQKFPFAEAAHDAGELITQINDLPDEKTLTFNIKTNFDSNTQQAQAQGYIPRSAGSSPGLG